MLLESYAGPRPRDADRILSPIRAEFERRGYLTGAALTEQIADKLSRSGASPSAADLSAAKTAVDEGHAEYLQARFDAAHAAAERGRAALMRAPAELAREQPLRAWHRKALAVIADAHRKQGNSDEAARAMAELVRSFPMQPLTTAEYAPAAVQFFHQVKADLEAQGTGNLSVTIDDDSAAIFINEVYAGVGSVDKPLLPGRYRVYVQQGNTWPGRVHEVDVHADADATLAISWDIDGHLRTAGDDAWLRFDGNGARRQREPQAAVQLARALGADEVVVVGVRDYGGRRSIVGTVLSLDSGRQVRSGTLALEPTTPSDDKIGKLGRFLAGDDDAGPFSPVREEVFSRAPSRPFKVWKWVALGAGVAGLATGGALIAIHDPGVDETGGDVRTEFIRDTRTPGIIAAAAGAVLVGVGVYMTVADRDRGREARVTVAPTRGGLGVALTGSF